MPRAHEEHQRVKSEQRAGELACACSKLSALLHTATEEGQGVLAIHQTTEAFGKPTIQERGKMKVQTGLGSLGRSWPWTLHEPTVSFVSIHKQIHKYTYIHRCANTLEQMPIQALEKGWFLF